jgi:hypothetical protein
MMNEHPLSSISMPTNTPMTHRPESGSDHQRTILKVFAHPNLTSTKKERVRQTGKPDFAFRNPLEDVMGPTITAPAITRRKDLGFHPWSSNADRRFVGIKRSWNNPHD